MELGQWGAGGHTCGACCAPTQQASTGRTTTTPAPLFPQCLSPKPHVLQVFSVILAILGAVGECQQSVSAVGASSDCQ